MRGKPRFLAGHTAFQRQANWWTREQLQLDARERLGCALLHVSCFSSTGWWRAIFRRELVEPWKSTTAWTRRAQYGHTSLHVGSLVSQSVAREWPVCLWRRPDNSNQQTHAPRKYAPKSLASNDHRNCWWQYGCARALPGRFGCRRLVCNGQSWPQLLPESANLNRKRARLTQNAKSVWRNQRVTWILNFPFLFIYSRAALYLIELILWPMHAIFILFAL